MSFQHCRQSACQISEQYNTLNYQSHSFETWQELIIRLLIKYRNRPQSVAATSCRYNLHTILEAGLMFLYSISHKLCKWVCCALFCYGYIVLDPWDLLTHWGRVTHICVSNLTIIGSDNGLSPGRRQAIIWTNTGILLIGPLRTNFNEDFNLNSNIFIQENTFESVVCEMAAILSRPQRVNPHFGNCFPGIGSWLLQCQWSKWRYR